MRYTGEMSKAVIFDVDGLLVNSEPYWREAKIDLFEPLGVPITMENVDDTMGLRADESVNYWFRKYPWEGPTEKEVTEQLIDAMVNHLETAEIMLPGVIETISIVEQAGLPMAIASSSPSRLIQAVTKSLGIEDKLSVVHSAEHETYGKPHPAVYIAAADQLGVSPEDCIAFEDSPNGLLAAKSAKMVCIAVPEAGTHEDPRFGIADKVLVSLNDFTPEILEEVRR